MGTVAAPFTQSVGVRLGVGDGGQYDGQDFSLFMFQDGNANGDFAVRSPRPRIMVMLNSRH